MITLKTLPEASAQQVFDQVAAHLLTQLRRSETDYRCAYRSHCGFKCAAGCLIVDSEYSKLMEGSDWNGLIERGYISGKHSKLISKLQDLHDMYDVSEWANMLKKIAYNFDLKFKFWN